MPKKNTEDNTIERQVGEYSSKAVSGFKWMASTTAVWQIISWVFTILTARVLDPTDYGIFALAETILPYMVLLSVFNISAWYIQEESVDVNVEKTFFTISMTLAIFFAAICYLSAGYVGAFYNNEDIVLPLQVLSLSFILNGYILLPMSQLNREMNFKSIALINFWTGISRVILVYILALMDFGYWALILGYLYVDIVSSIWITYLKGLPPGFGFDARIAKKMLRFGAATTGAGVLHIVFSTADDLLIGKFLGSEALGYYFMAFYLMDMPLAKFNNLTKPLLFSYFSKIRNYDDKLKNIFLGVSKAALWLIFPILIGMALVASELVPIVFGEKWNAMVMPLIFLCIAGLFRAFTDHIPPLFVALGRPDMSLKINLITVVILPLSFYFAVTHYGMSGILWAWVLVYPLVSLMILTGLSRLTIISKLMYIKNLKIPFTCTLAMISCVLAVDAMMPEETNIHVILITKIVVGVLAYASVSYFVFKDEIFRAMKLLRE